MEQRKRNKLFNCILWGAAGLAGVFLVWGFWVEPNRLTVRRAVVTLPGLPESMERCRAVLVADTHFGSSFFEKMRRARIIKAVRAENPHICFLLGDYIAAGSLPHYGAMKQEDLLHFFRSLKAPLGCYAVLGNHELWYGRKKMTELLEKAGVRMIENHAVKLKEGLVFAGVPERATAPFDVRGFNLFLKKVKPHLVIGHKGDTLKYLALPPETLMFAADTHGGQVRLPGVGGIYHLWYRKKELPPGFSTRWGKGLFITSGAGGHRLNFRFLCPPEIAVVTFTGKNKI